MNDCSIAPTSAPQRRSMRRPPRFRSGFLAVALATSTVMLLATAAISRGETPLAPRPTAAEDRLREDLIYLAHDQREGRGVGTNGLQQAARYIADVFAQAGLNTQLFDGQPMQTLQIPLPPAAGPAEENGVQAQRDGQPLLTAELDRQMRPLSLGASGQASGPLVFAGYGISAPHLGYDDYAGLDASGAVVMILRKAPGDGKGPLSDKANQQHAYFSTKIGLAVEQGARAVLLVNDPRSVEDALQQLRRRREAESQRGDALRQSIEQTPEELEQVRQTFRNSLDASLAQLAALETDLQQAEHGLLRVGEAGSAEGPAAIPVVSLSRKAASDLLASSIGQTLTAIERQIADSMRPHSFRDESTTVAVQAAVKSGAASSQNVIAEFPGAGPLADETVIIGAHYDHVGMGGYGSLAPGTVAVHNGADDNASGTVVLLELARRLQDRLAASPSRRRVVLAAFTAEERGLLGSAHYVRQPRFPLEDTVAMINLDMVGRLRDNELTVYGSGTATEFDALLDQVNSKAAFQLVRITSGYGPSDHQSFYERGIPVLFFFTGLHNDYHRPSDDSDKIDLGGLIRITDMVTDVVCHLALTAERPTYQSTDRSVEIRRQLTAFLGITMAIDPAGRLRIDEVAVGSPAERGGLRAGDIVSEIHGKPAGGIADVRSAVRARNPGDLMTLTVLRDGQPMAINVILGERP